LPVGTAKATLPAGRAEADGGVEIIDHLRHQPSPVDRVDRAQAEAPGKVAVVEHRLHQRLGIVEAALDRDVVDVRRQHRGHLAALHVGHPALGMQHEDVDAVSPGDCVDRGAAGVARRRADDGQRLGAAHQEFLEQQPEQLERDVLERQRRAVEQLEQEMAVVELDQRRHRGLGEAAIGLRAQFAQLVFAQVVAGERRHHPNRGLDIGKALQPLDLLAREARPAGRNIQAAVARQAGKRDVTETKQRRGASGALILHDGGD
jgi:hypothetical protein